jgi:hypothetical protein
MRYVLAVFTLSLTITLCAQVNSAGRVQIGLGASGGIHATEFENSFSFFGVAFKNSSTDAAATVSYPVDFHVGISNRFSLGLCVETGSYIDSAGTRPNAFLVIAFCPRFYAINKERLALLFNLDAGISGLRIGDVQSGLKKYDDSYAGGHFGLGTQFQYYFGRTFGLNVGAKYTANYLKWRDRDPEDPFLKDASYEALLKTSGIQFQFGAQVKF